MKFVNKNDVSIITKFILFFINKNYHFRIIFYFNLNNYNFIKKRLLIKQNEFIAKINKLFYRIRQN